MALPLPAIQQVKTQFFPVLSENTGLIRETLTLYTLNLSHRSFRRLQKLSAQSETSANHEIQGIHFMNSGEPYKKNLHS